jgi:hypothetical protein
MPRTVDLDQLLARKRALETRASESRDFLDRLRDLRVWQARRLAQTYDDLRGDPRYAPAIGFFLNDLYGSLDSGPRDRQLARASPLLRHGLPGAARAALERAIELDVLSAELDHAMVALISSCPISGAGYADAYRLVGRRDARERQIELILSVGAVLDRIVRYAWIGSALHLWQAPARAIGFGVLHDFLDRGFDAFRNIADARTFLQTIREREVQLMEQLFAGGGEEVFTARSR